MPTEESFGQLFHKLRKNAHLTQRDLAIAIDVDYTYISKIESGSVAPPHRDRIELAAKAMKASPDETADLFRLAEKIPPDVSSMISEHPNALRLFRRIRDIPARDRARMLEELIEKVEAREKHRKGSKG